MTQGERTPVTTVAELDALDMTEMLEGYNDGLVGEPEPGQNRSKSYWHGYHNGRRDRSGEYSADAATLAHAVLKAPKRRASPSPASPAED